MDMIQIEILGFVASATNLFSSVPQLLANLRNPQLACGQSVSRNCFQCAGNGLWMLYGVTVGSLSMTTFATLGCVMAGGLVFQTLRAKTHSWAEAHQPPLSKLSTQIA